MKRQLPTGIQSFRKMRERNCYYVDKTRHIKRLVDTGTSYFLSRPRRFGKSLLVDTIKELFEGSRELFENLHVYDRWDWSVRRPVVRLDFSGGNYTIEGGLATELDGQLTFLEAVTATKALFTDPQLRFRWLIESLHRHSGHRVVVLVDEYDKPMLDALGNPDLARVNRDALRSLYGNIKTCDAHIHFTLLTGVTKFGKVNLFSGINNLKDITLNPAYATICGYTEQDLDEVFGPELDGFDRTKIREWYNGYNWLGDELVYNPFDILLLFDERKFEAHWFGTGSPAFLIDVLKRRGVGPLQLDRMVASRELLAAFDVDHISTEALLFQTGNLTIRELEEIGEKTYYRLGYPNREVRECLNEQLLDAIGWKRARASESRKRLHEILRAADFPGLAEWFHALFASIPYNWHVRNDIARFEGYYASVVYASIASLGVHVVVEDASAVGRVDLAVRVGGRVLLFEFKVVEEAGQGAALAQLKKRNYAEKYRGLGEPVHLVGVEFSAEGRNLAAFETEVV